LGSEEPLCPASRPHEKYSDFHFKLKMKEFKKNEKTKKHKKGLTELANFKNELRSINKEQSANKWYWNKK
ncbi:hypothetical protein PMALA_054440, partial [Plasmodium malariae]